MGRLLFISALIHAVLLIVLPLLPGLARDYDETFDVYAVELLDVTAQPPAVEEAEPMEPSPVPSAEEPVVEEKPEEPAIPEDPTPAPRRVVLKPPPSRKEPTLEERLKERLKVQDARRPETLERPESREEIPAARTASTLVSTPPSVAGWYVSIIQGKVYSNWTQPSERLIAEDSLTVSVSFVIMKEGSVHDIRVSRSSGRTTLDQSAVRAVRDSGPFPSLDGVYLKDRIDVTIVFSVTRL